MSDGTRERWLAGKCPCCGAGIREWHDGTQPEAIGEGVMICGRCVANEHLADPVFRGLMLAAILPAPGMVVT